MFTNHESVGSQFLPFFTYQMMKFWSPVTHAQVGKTPGVWANAKSCHMPHGSLTWPSTPVLRGFLSGFCTNDFLVHSLAHFDVSLQNDWLMTSHTDTRDSASFWNLQISKCACQKLAGNTACPWCWYSRNLSQPGTAEAGMTAARSPAHLFGCVLCLFTSFAKYSQCSQQNRPPWKMIIHLPFFHLTWRIKPNQKECKHNQKDWALCIPMMYSIWDIFSETRPKGLIWIFTNQWNNILSDYKLVSWCNSCSESFTA